MKPLARLPIFFALAGKRTVIAGGNAGAAWKAELLAAAGASVDVYATEISAEMIAATAHPPDGAIAIHERRWRDQDLAGAAIAIGAFDNDRDAADFARASRAAGVPVNVVDKPAFCDFAFGAIVNRSPLVIGISTDGAAPVFAQAIRAKLEAYLPTGFAAWAAAAQCWRARLKEMPLSFAARRRFWQAFTGHAVRHPDVEPTERQFDALVAEVRREGGVAETGSVTLVGAGPGDPELLTLRAVRALQSADIILFDDLVAPEILDFARREARKLLVGKRGYGPSCRQEDVNRLMVSLARAGKRVVRLKGGDPLIFGRASEEIAACRGAGIAVEVVPGITAAQGAAGRLGVSLTQRHTVQRMQYLTGHAKSGALPDNVDWRSMADPHVTTAVYMPAATLHTLTARMIAEGLDPSTPSLAIARATRPDETIVAGTIAEIAARVDAASPGGPLIVLLGKVFAKLVHAGAQQKELAS